MRHQLSILLLLACIAVIAGCAYNDSRITVNTPAGVAAPGLTIIQAGNTATTSKPIDVQANGNDLSYAAGGAALGAGVGAIAGNPAAGALIGAGGGVAVYHLKAALTPAVTPVYTAAPDAVKSVSEARDLGAVTGISSLQPNSLQPNSLSIPVPAVPAASVVPAATGTAIQAVTAPSAAVTGTPSAAPAAADAQGGDANGARGTPPGG